MSPKSENITAIFEEIYPSLCRFLESIVGREMSAQDIAQESFLRLCQADIGKIPQAEIRFWLFRVARNLALNEIDKGKRRTKFWHQLIEFFSKNEANPEEVLVRNERQKIVMNLLEKIPEQQRSALLLREREEMSYREIGLILNISESKVKIDIYRARQSLRKLWFETQGDKDGM